MPGAFKRQFSKSPQFGRKKIYDILLFFRNGINISRYIINILPVQLFHIHHGG